MSFLLQPISFLFIIFLSYFLKRIGVFKKEHSMILLNIFLDVTLPAVAITAFSSFDGEYSLFLLILIGLLVAMCSYFLMFLFTIKMKKEKRIYYMISVSGLDVGSFGIPVINAFYGNLGAIICVVYDIGNCLMLTSGNYAFTTALLKTEGDDVKVRVGDVLKRFFSSVPTDVYLVLIVLSLFGIYIPQGVVDFINPLASANAFVVMFMLGLLFTLPRNKSDWKGALLVLAFRLGVNGALAVLLFFILPFSLEIRQIVVLMLLCPVGAMSPGFIERCHGDGELAAFTNSLSIIVSLVLMSVLAGVVFA